MSEDQRPEMFDTPEPPDKPMPELTESEAKFFLAGAGVMPLTLELVDKGRSGLASINQHLTNEKARIERQLAIVVEATRAVIKYDADTVDGLPQHIRDGLVDRWRRNA